MQIPSPLFHLQTRDGVTLEEESHKQLAEGEVGLVSRAHGKIFVKFVQEVTAKQARYGLSGRTYNGRTVVGAFYPEHLFDQGEFNL